MTAPLPEPPSWGGEIQQDGYPARPLNPRRPLPDDPALHDDPEWWAEVERLTAEKKAQP